MASAGAIQSMPPTARRSFVGVDDDARAIDWRPRRRLRSAEPRHDPAARRCTPSGSSLRARAREHARRAARSTAASGRELWPARIHLASHYAVACKVRTPPLNNTARPGRRSARPGARGRRRRRSGRGGRGGARAGGGRRRRSRGRRSRGARSRRRAARPHAGAATGRGGHGRAPGTATLASATYGSSCAVAWLVRQASTIARNENTTIVITSSMKMRGQRHVDAVVGDDAFHLGGGLRRREQVGPARARRRISARRR